MATQFRSRQPEKSMARKKTHNEKDRDMVKKKEIRAEYDQYLKEEGRENDPDTA